MCKYHLWHFIIVLALSKSITSESFIVFFCFGTIPIIILSFRINPLTSQISETASHSTTKLHSYIDPYPTMCSARFGVDSDHHSGSRAKSVFSDSLIISKTYHRIFNCNTSKRRSGQELPYQKWEIKHGQIQEEMNSTIRYFDTQNIVLDTKIIILCALVQKLWPKTHFCEITENITYP